MRSNTFLNTENYIKEIFRFSNVFCINVLHAFFY